MSASSVKFRKPFSLQNVKAASHGLNAASGEVAVANLVDKMGTFVACGGFEAMVEKASQMDTFVENETEARYLAMRFGGGR